MKTTPKTDTFRFTGKGQVLIPHWLRKELVIEEGTPPLFIKRETASY